MGIGVAGAARRMALMCRGAGLTHAVAAIISTAPIQLWVNLAYMAPKVMAGAMHAKNTKNETATVFWSKFVISDLQ